MWQRIGQNLCKSVKCVKNFALRSYRFPTYMKSKLSSTGKTRYSTYSKYATTITIDIITVCRSILKCHAIDYHVSTTFTYDNPVIYVYTVNATSRAIDYIHYHVSTTFTYDNPI